MSCFRWRRPRPSPQSLCGRCFLAVRRQFGELSAAAHNTVRPRRLQKQGTRWLKSAVRSCPFSAPGALNHWVPFVPSDEDIAAAGWRSKSLPAFRNTTFKRRRGGPLSPLRVVIPAAERGDACPGRRRTERAAGELADATDYLRLIPARHKIASRYRNPSGADDAVPVIESPHSDQN